MAPTDGVDTTDGSSPPLARRYVVGLTIAGSCLAGVVGGFAAFGVAHAFSSAETTLAAGSSQSQQTTTEPRPVEDQIPAQPPSIVPSTVTMTATSTPETTSRSSEGGSSSGGASARTGSGAATSTVRGAGDPDASPDVLPERVLPSITTTPEAPDDEPVVRQAGTGDVEKSDKTSQPPAGREGGDKSDDEAGKADDDKAGDRSDTDRGTDDQSEPTTTVPTGNGEPNEDRGEDAPPAPAPDNALLSDRVDLSAQRIDGAFRNALAPGVPAERRDQLFEGGAAARPLTDRLASLSTGSVPLLHWSVHEPLIIDGDRATLQVRSDVLFNQSWRPVTFVNVDGQWKLTRESTCELSASLLLPCA